MGGDDPAVGSLRDGAQGAGLVVDAEQVLVAVVDLVQHSPVGDDEVFIRGQHARLGQGCLIGDRIIGPVAELHAPDAGDVDLDAFLDQRKLEIESGVLFRADVLAEKQDDCLLVRSEEVEAGEGDDGGDDQDRDDEQETRQLQLLAGFTELASEVLPVWAGYLTIHGIDFLSKCEQWFQMSGQGAGLGPQDKH